MPIASPPRPLTLFGLALAAAGIALPASTLPALAHPHVWVTTKAEIAYGEGGRVTGIRHAWTFDAAYSAFVTQGLDTNKDGTLSPDELAGLAAENTANLAEFAYFTKMKVGGKEQAFADPAEPRMAMEGDKLTLSFLLPLKAPAAQGRGVTAVEVYDPTFFVSFSLAEEPDAARLSGAPNGCAATVTRPKPDAARTADTGSAGAKPADGKSADGKSSDSKSSDSKPGMSEAFFEALTSASNYGVQFANRIIVACP